MTKSIFKSKVFWINILAGAAVAIPGLQLPISAQVQITILAAVNIILRAVTTEPIKLR